MPGVFVFPRIVVNAPDIILSSLVTSDPHQHLFFIYFFKLLDLPRRMKQIKIL
jgi:hypothetical protein